MKMRGDVELTVHGVQFHPTAAREGMRSDERNTV